MVTVARSRTLAGPYEVDPRNPILTSRSNPALPLQKAGHASLVATQDGSWYLAHLCGRPLPGTRLCHLGRETAIQKCHWTADGWLRLSGGGNEPALEVEAPDLPACPWPAEPGRDDCDAPTLGPEFNTLRSPPAADWLSLTERPGYLRLRGRESLTSCFRVSLVARRLQSFQCEATMRLEFSPETFQQSAGLVCIYDHRHFLFLRVSHDESAGRNVAVLAEDQGRLSPSDEVPIDAAAPCYLRVRFDDRAVQFFHSADAGTWRPIGPQYDAGKLSDDYCQGFTGTFIGLAATDSSGRSIRADFDFFEYREQEEA